jgi:hypothetical protein
LRASPSLAQIIPLLALGALLGLGLWAVQVVCNEARDTARTQGYSLAQQVGSALQEQLQASFEPAFSLAVVIEQLPQLEQWSRAFPTVAAQVTSACLCQGANLNTLLGSGWAK